MEKLNELTEDLFHVEIAIGDAKAELGEGQIAAAECLDIAEEYLTKLKKDLLAICTEKPKKHCGDCKYYKFDEHRFGSWGNYEKGYCLNEKTPLYKQKHEYQIRPYKGRCCKHFEEGQKEKHDDQGKSISAACRNAENKG